MKQVTLICDVCHQPIPSTDTHLVLSEEAPIDRPDICSSNGKCTWIKHQMHMHVDCLIDMKTGELKR